MSSPDVKRYHTALVVLHWLLALAILAMLFAGHFITAATPNSEAEKLNHLRGHMIMGMAVGFAMILRVITRLKTQHPPEAKSGMALADALAPWVHRAIYLCIFAMVGSGMATAMHFGLPDVVFNGQGQLPADFHSFAGRAVHGLFARLLALLLLAHIGAALFHQFILKDGLFARMGFGPRR